MVCWGALKDQGQLSPNYTRRVVASNIIQISSWSNGNITYALRNDGTVLYWGYISGNYISLPHVVHRAFSNIVQISAGKDHFCALKDNGRVLCSGSNHYGQLGNGQYYNYESHDNPPPGIPHFPDSS